MSNLKKTAKTSSEKLTEKKPEEATTNKTPKDERSPKEKLMENLNKYLPSSYADNYDDLAKVEENILGLQEQIDQINDLIKPITRLDRKRGAKSQVTASERKLLKSTREKLKTQLIIERNNWDREYKSHRDGTQDEIRRTKNEQLAEQGRSGYYVHKYKGTVVHRIKSFFDTVLENDSAALTRFKRNFTNSRGDAAITLIIGFIREHQENPFLLAFFQSHKDLHVRYTRLIRELLREWNGRSNSNFKFKESELTVTEEI